MDRNGSLHRHVKVALPRPTSNSYPTIPEVRIFWAAAVRSFRCGSKSCRVQILPNDARKQRSLSRNARSAQLRAILEWKVSVDSPSALINNCDWCSRLHDKNSRCSPAGGHEPNQASDRLGRRKIVGEAEDRPMCAIEVSWAIPLSRVAL